MGKYKSKNNQKHFEVFKISHKPLLKSLNYKKMQMMYKEILELANSNRIFIKNYDGQISEFNFAVCSKIAYDSLIADSSREYVYSTALNQLNEILEDKNSFRRFSFLVDFNDPEKLNLITQMFSI